MGVSSPNRVFNVHLMADFLNGYKIAPGARFSFNQAVGPRTADRGFLEGQAIENGVLVPSIGGGVCQVATTVFDAAINGGYEVNERHNHSFYIDHYPTGLDATVADGGPDFAFTNNTGHTVVVQTSYTDQTLTVQLLSAPIHRTVTISDPVPTNYVEPGKRYVADPDNTPDHKLAADPQGGLQPRKDRKPTGLGGRGGFPRPRGGVEVLGVAAGSDAVVVQHLLVFRPALRIHEAKTCL